MNLHSFNWVDWIIIGIVLLSALVSLARGFVREALSLLVWIVALWAAFRYHLDFANAFLSSIESSSIRTPLGFVAVFLAVMIAGGIINFILSGMMYRTGLSGTDRLLGLVFGAARGVLLSAVLILVVEMMGFSENSAWEQSQLAPQLEGIVQWLHNLIPEEVDKFRSDSVGTVQDVISSTVGQVKNAVSGVSMPSLPSLNINH